MFVKDLKWYVAILLVQGLVLLEPSQLYIPLVVLSHGQGVDNDSEAEIDIVAVHGLNPRNRDDHAFNTWRKPRNERGHLWLKDSLPKSLPRARTMIYSYNSSPSFNPTKERMVHEAVQLLEDISVVRFDCPRRPLILIGHSYGGILIKQAIVLAKASGNAVHQEISRATSTLVFLATPHSGPSDTIKIQIGKVCAGITKQIVGGESTDIMKALERNSMFRDVLEESWKHELESYQIISVYGIDDKSVPRESAILGLPGGRETVIRMDADHGDVCRFDPGNETDQQNYRRLEVALMRTCKFALKEDHSNRSAVSESIKNDILTSLMEHGSNPRYGGIDQEHTDTLQWIWASEENEGPGFLEWMALDGGLFWLNGKPGAGKSTLMKFIHDDDRTVEEIAARTSERVILISFFFYEQGVPSERTFSGLLHGLLSQILTEMPELISCIQSRFKRLKSRSRSSNKSIWSEPELQKAFKDILEQKEGKATILCLVDGLDECQGKDLHPMLQFLLNLTGKARLRSMKFKVICSSRPENAIDLAFTHHSMLRVQDFNSGDIMAFVADGFKAITNNLNPLEEFHKISDDLTIEIVWKAKGVFIWVKLVMAELLIAVEDGDLGCLSDKLDQLPSDLEDLYTRIIDKIPQSVRHHTINTLQLFPYIGHPGPTSLLALLLTPDIPEDVLTMEPRIMTAEDKIRECITKRRVLQHRCRGLLQLPLSNSKWSQEELVFNFCRGEVSVHKTVLDYLAMNDNLAKLSYGVDPKLLIKDHHRRMAAFYFCIMKCDPVTRTQALSNNQTFKCDENYGQSLSKAFGAFLGSIMLSERDAKDEFLAPTWLPLVEEYLRIQIPDLVQFEDFLDHQMIDSYISFERCSDEPPLHRWHSNFLSIAVHRQIHSYIRENLDGKEKLGRPLLNYLMRRIQRPRDVLLLNRMFLKGYDMNTRFNGWTTWEYLLLAIREDPRDLDTLAATISIFLEHGADPNHPIDLHGYCSSPLHLVLTADPILPYEIVYKVLLSFIDNGANVNVADSAQCSTVEMAEKNWPQAVEFLKSHISGDMITLVSTTTKEWTPATSGEVNTELLLQMEKIEKYRSSNLRCHRRSIKTGKVYGPVDTNDFELLEEEPV